MPDDLELGLDLPQPFIKEFPVPNDGIFDAPCVCMAVNVRWLTPVLQALMPMTRPDFWQGDENEKTEGTRGASELIGALMAGNCGEHITGLSIDSHGKLTATYTDASGATRQESVGTFKVTEDAPPVEKMTSDNSGYICYAIHELIDFLLDRYNFYLDKCQQIRDGEITLSKGLLTLLEDLFTFGIEIPYAESSIDMAKAITDYGTNELRLAASDPTWQERIKCSLFDRIQAADGFFSEATYDEWVEEDIHFDDILIPGEMKFEDWVKDSFNFSYLSRRWSLSLGDTEVETDCELCGCEETWSQDFDFTVSDCGFSAFDGYAIYDPGYGWKDNNSGLIIYKAIDTTEIRYATCDIDTSQYFGVYFRETSGGENIASVDGTGTHVEGSLGVGKNVGWFYINGSYPPGGHITHLHLEGCGENPFI